MKIEIKHFKGDIFEIDAYFTQEFQGRGGWKIYCHVEFMGKKQKFSHYTTSASFIDEIDELKANDASNDTIQQAYKNHSFDKMDEIILEWCMEIKEKLYEESYEE